MSATPTCSYPRCRRRTKDATGRCQDHRAKGLVTTASPPPPVIAPRPATEGGGKRTLVTHSDGSTRETWTDERKRLSRTDGPATVARDQEGNVTHESYYLHGEEHRKDGPAKITYHQGRVTSEHYYFHGAPHRVDGPYSVGYSEDDGKIYSRSYAVLGRHFRNERAMYGALRSEGAGRLREILTDSPYRPLLKRIADPKDLLDLFEDGIRSVEGVTAVLDGAPREWARSFEEGRAR